MQVFRSVSRAPFWPYLGLILAPSWPLLGPSWPHSGFSWLHLGPILASSWPSWPFLAPSWPLPGPVLALLAALGPILALGSLVSLGPHVGQLSLCPMLAYMRRMRKGRGKDLLHTYISELSLGTQNGPKLRALLFGMNPS